MTTDETTAELSTLRSQIDALKAEVARKDEALKTALRQWAGYADGPRAMDEMYLDRADDQEARMYQDCQKALAAKEAGR